MIGEMSKRATEKLIENQIIGKEDFDLYNYGLFILISETLLFVYCLSVGAVLKNILPSVLFYIFFSLVHRFSGGFHAKTELHCLIITLSFFLISIILIKLSTQLNCITLIAFYVCCSIILIILSPADTPQKPLSNKEKFLFKKMTSLIIVVGFIVIVALFVKNIYLYANAIVIAVFLQTLSIICGRLFNKRLLTNK